MKRHGFYEGNLDKQRKRTVDYNRRMRERRAAAFRGAFVGDDRDSLRTAKTVNGRRTEKTRGRRCCLAGQRYGCMNPNVQD